MGLKNLPSGGDPTKKSAWGRSGSQPPARGRPRRLKKNIRSAIIRQTGINFGDLNSFYIANLKNKGLDSRKNALSAAKSSSLSSLSSFSSLTRLPLLDPYPGSPWRDRGRRAVIIVENDDASLVADTAPSGVLF